MDQQLIKQIWNEILMEACFGEIHVDEYTYNIGFASQIVCDGKMRYYPFYKDSNVPTLILNDETAFLFYLDRYILEADLFYDIPYEKKEQRYKMLLTLLFSNITTGQFQDPISFLKERIQFFHPHSLHEINGTVKECGPLFLGSQIHFHIIKNSIYQETPYAFYMEAVSDNMHYIFPYLSFGIGEENGKHYATIFALQNEKESLEKGIEEKRYASKLNRLFYHVNENFKEEAVDIDNIENPENLTGIVPSQLITLTAFLSLCEHYHIEEVRMPAFLPMRFYAKERYYQKKADYLYQDENEKSNYLVEAYKEQERIQRNLTDKMIRSVRRLDYHFPNINIKSYSYELDEYLHIRVNPYVGANNPLLDSIYQIFDENKKNDKNCSK